MSDALKPCPFCGEDASIGRGHRGWFVNCQDCLASTNQLMNEPETEAEAIAAWNTRAAPRVKPLAWVESVNYGENWGWTARCTIGAYLAGKSPFGESFGFRLFGEYGSNGLPTLDAARAAAQADYTARILAALDVTPQNTHGGLAGGLAEAPICHDVENNRESEE